MNKGLNSLLMLSATNFYLLSILILNLLLFSLTPANKVEASTTLAIDTIPPTVPTNLSATSISRSQINLSWTASTDPDSSVSGYNIYRGGILIATSSSNSLSDTNSLVASTTYSYTVSAYDVQGNTSSQSSSASATTSLPSTYYIAATGGSDSYPGTSAQPWATFSYAFNTGMQTGDTLIIKDGIYNQNVGYHDTNSPSSSWSAPNGTSTSFTLTSTTTLYTIVKAQNDGQAIIQDGQVYLGGSFEGLKAINGSSFVSIEGLKLRRSSIEVSFSHHIKILKVGIKDPLPIDSRYGTGIDIACSHDMLIEDSWVIGTFRYGIGLSETYNSIVRRAVTRFDANTGNQPRAGIDFYGAASGTGCFSTSTIQPTHDSILENSIMLDFNSATTSPGVEGGMNLPHDYQNIKVYGSIVLNLPQGNGWEFGGYANAGGSQIVNSIAWGLASTTEDGIVLWDGSPASTMIINQVTVGSARAGDEQFTNGTGIHPSTTVKNSIFYNNTSANDLSDHIINYNWYYPANQAQGTNYLTTNPGFKYITRSPDTGTGEGGVKRGATIEYRYGASGTMYGDTGYDQLTSDALWPWPYESRIYNDAAEAETNPSYTSGSNVMNRGFAASGTGLYGGPKTLTSYIWEYLGNPCPASICGNSTTPLVTITQPGITEVPTKIGIPVSAQTVLIFTKPLIFGLKQNNDVKKLQKLLKTDNTVYPKGIVTGNFGFLTKKAVERFQLKYGITTKNGPGYGVVGPKTRKKLNEIYSQTKD